MGNRAVIAFGSSQGKAPAIYLHWNGGLSKVTAFVNAARELGIRDPEGDPEYAAARFAQMLGNFSRGETGLGVGCVDRLDTDNGDNGTYVLGKGWRIVQRLHECGEKGVDKAEHDMVLAEVLRINKPLFVEDHKQTVDVTLRSRQPKEA